jgi:hypothetical protein
LRESDRLLSLPGVIVILQEGHKITVYIIESSLTAIQVRPKVISKIGVMTDYCIIKVRLHQPTGYCFRSKLLGFRLINFNQSHGSSQKQRIPEAFPMKDVLS